MELLNRTLYSPSDIELDSATIVSLPLGPDIDSLSFTTGISINESLPQPNMGIYSSPDEDVFLGYFEGEDETQTNETDDSDESIDEGVESQTVFLNLSSIYQLNIADQPQSLPYTNSESQTLDVNFIVNNSKVGKSLAFDVVEKLTITNENKIIFFSISFHPFFFYIHLAVLYLF